MTGWLTSLCLLFLIVYIIPAQDIWQALHRINLLLVLPAMLLVILNLYLRGHRWALFFRPGMEVSGIEASRPIMIGLLVSAVIPGRVGELVRIVLGSTKFKSGFAFTTVTVAADRMLDGFTLLFFLGTSIFLLGGFSISVSGHSEVQSSIDSQTVLVVFRSVLVVSLLMLFFIAGIMFSGTRSALKNIIARLPIIGSRISGLFGRLLGNASQGLEALRNPKSLFKLVSLSLGLWFLLAMSTYCIAYGMDGIELNLLQALVITSIAIAVSSIPSAPGAWGVFEAGTLLSVKLLGLPGNFSDWVAFAFILHFSQYIPVVFMGLMAMLKEGMSVSNLKLVISSSQEFKTENR